LLFPQTAAVACLAGLLQMVDFQSCIEVQSESFNGSFFFFDFFVSAVAPQGFKFIFVEKLIEPVSIKSGAHLCWFVGDRALIEGLQSVAVKLLVLLSQFIETCGQGGNLYYFFAKLVWKYVGFELFFLKLFGDHCDLPYKLLVLIKEHDGHINSFFDHTWCFLMLFFVSERLLVWKSFCFLALESVHEHFPCILMLDESLELFAEVVLHIQI
jgi:hypothetical protein